MCAPSSSTSAPRGDLTPGDVTSSDCEARGDVTDARGDVTEAADADGVVLRGERLANEN